MAKVATSLRKSAIACVLLASMSAALGRGGDGARPGTVRVLLGLAAVVALAAHELAEVLVIANGVRAGRIKQP